MYIELDINITTLGILASMVIGIVALRVIGQGKKGDK